MPSFPFYSRIMGLSFMVFVFAKRHSMESFYMGEKEI